ncbi:hypothetical protein GHK86_18650 [Acidimicrobiaceae bacterium USS-CC1]|uniref:Uncharacterized protein n=1 Tax=Acidiferrimicrobium australe TaxID=2664430 RepID=A0ABW9QZ55_9ACTN|nr:hypothetical protein [Acidiferrimicrobium australe]
MAVVAVVAVVAVGRRATVTRTVVPAAPVTTSTPPPASVARDRMPSSP